MGLSDGYFIGSVAIDSHYIDAGGQLDTPGCAGEDGDCYGDAGGIGDSGGAAFKAGESDCARKTFDFTFGSGVGHIFYAVNFAGADDV